MQETTIAGQHVSTSTQTAENHVPGDGGARESLQHAQDLTTTRKNDEGVPVRIEIDDAALEEIRRAEDALVTELVAIQEVTFLLDGVQTKIELQTITEFKYRSSYSLLRRGILRINGEERIVVVKLAINENGIVQLQTERKAYNSFNQTMAKKNPRGDTRALQCLGSGQVVRENQEKVEFLVLEYINVPTVHRALNEGTLKQPNLEDAQEVLSTLKLIHAIFLSPKDLGDRVYSDVSSRQFFADSQQPEVVVIAGDFGNVLEEGQVSPFCTRAYASLEQIIKEPARQWFDVYALGVLAAELLGLEVPGKLDATRMSIWRKIASVDVSMKSLEVFAKLPVWARVFLWCCRTSNKQLQFSTREEARLFLRSCIEANDDDERMPLIQQKLARAAPESVREDILSLIDVYTHTYGAKFMHLFANIIVSVDDDDEIVETSIPSSLDYIEKPTWESVTTQGKNYFCITKNGAVYISSDPHTNCNLRDKTDMIAFGLVGRTETDQLEVELADILSCNPITDQKKNSSRGMTDPFQHKVTEWLYILLGKPEKIFE